MGLVFAYNGGNVRGQADIRYFSNDEFGRRVPNGEHHWEHLFSIDYSITKPTVLCLFGNATTTLPEANGGCKFVENLLGLIKRGDENILDRVDLLGFKYSKDNQWNETGSLSLGFIDGFVNQVLLPMFRDEKYMRLPLDKACKNMSKVMFFSYCQGQVEANKIMDALDWGLEKLGYSQDEIEKINNATINVSFAPLDHKRNYMPSIRVLSTKDERVGEDIRFMYTSSEILDIDGIDVKVDGAGEIYGEKRRDALSGSINVISSELLNKTGKDADEHLIDILSRNESWGIKKFANSFGDKVESENADCVSQIMAYALGLAIENAEKNMTSSHYIPNNFETTLPSEIRSIIDGFNKKDLQLNKSKRWEDRCRGYNSDRWEKLKQMSKNFLDYSSPQSIMYSSLANAKTFKEVATIFEENNYANFDTLLPIVGAELNEYEKTVLEVGAKHRAINKEKRKWLCKPNAVVVEALKKAKSFDEICAIIENFDYINARIFLTKLMELEDREYTPTSDECARMLAPLKDEHQMSRTARKQRAVYNISNELSEVKSDENALETVANIFEKYDYFGAYDLVFEVADRLNKEERDALLIMSRAKQEGLNRREKHLQIPAFEELVDTLNNAESLEEIVEKYAKYGFCGARYVLPEVLVLNDLEKSQILDMVEPQKGREL